MFFLLLLIGSSLRATLSVPKQAEEGDFPFDAVIMYQGDFICAGALIVHDFVVTTAHCVNEKSYRYMRIITGTVQGSKFHDENINIVDRILVHPRYSSVTKDFNVALVKLRTPVRPTNVVHKIDLIDPDYAIEAGATATLAYWDHNEGAVLKSDDLMLWHPYNCTAINIWGDYNFNLPVPLPTENTFCGNIPQSRCIPNEAAAVLLNNTLLGILSWQDRCDTVKAPLVFSNMAIYGEWINLIFNDEEKYLG